MAYQGEIVHLVLDAHKDSHAVNYDMGARVQEKIRLPLRDNALRNTADGDTLTAGHLSSVKRHRHHGASAPARIALTSQLRRPIAEALYLRRKRRHGVAMEFGMATVLKNAWGRAALFRTRTIGATLLVLLLKCADVRRPILAAWRRCVAPQPRNSDPSECVDRSPLLAVWCDVRVA